MKAPIYPHEKLECGQTLEVAPGIHWVRMPLPFALNHINVWLIEEDDGFTVIDTGYNLENVRQIWRDVLGRIVGGRPIRRAIVTHFHPDHIGLAGWFAKQYGAELWTPYAEWMQAHLSYDMKDGERWYAFYVANGLPTDRAEVQRMRRGRYAEACAPIPMTLRRIWDGMTVKIGGRDWRVITGAGHSPEHAALYCNELKLLISGDQVLPRITTNVSVWYNEPYGNPLRQFIESFAKFRPLPHDTFVLPSHDRPFYGLHDRLDTLVAHHGQRFDKAHAACAEPKTAMEVVPALFTRQLDDQQIGFAIGESLAHLNYLLNDGRLERFADRDGKFRFKAV